MNPSAQLRRAIADKVAHGLLGSGKAREVWLEGALACGFAHAASDIDLRGIVDGEVPVWRSGVVDGVRVDLQATAPQQVDELRHLLSSFDVRRGDLESFRLVRAAMHDLMCLRSALSYSYRSGNWQPVLGPRECQGYRHWAVADQAEVAASLAEDLTGLVADGLAESTLVVCRKLDTCLTAIECAAAGHPVLGDKWLPLLADAQPARPIEPVRAHTAGAWQWFRPVQRRVTTALLACWPVDDPVREPPDLGAPDEGWLPQRYADGWFLRRGDVHIPATGGELLGWLSTISADST
ncbi:hypothetical protein [Streptomyces sp. MUSC 125]|uniref:hypothetical protein n=1 Tax=Streptomyces sp. MUSC 125 TaxID=1428624 RepID=UPI000690B922|nr:hypothetical protein [Streptomyces sp. MUSC 125]